MPHAESNSIAKDAEERVIRPLNADRTANAMSESDGNLEADQIAMHAAIDMFESRVRKVQAERDEALHLLATLIVNMSASVKKHRVGLDAGDPWTMLAQLVDFARERHGRLIGQLAEGGQPEPESTT